MDKSLSHPLYTLAVVNSSRDFAMCGDAKHLIGKPVMVIRQKKNGLYVCREIDGEIEYEIPKYNLDDTGYAMSTIDHDYEKTL